MTNTKTPKASQLRRYRANVTLRSHKSLVKRHERISVVVRKLQTRIAYLEDLFEINSGNEPDQSKEEE